MTQKKSFTGTGYMFGKGIYFADMVSKSANYCATNIHQNIGLMLLSEVALGDMHELTRSHFVKKLPEGKHSTKGKDSFVILCICLLIIIIFKHAI